MAKALMIDGKLPDKGLVTRVDKLRMRRIKIKNYLTDNNSTTYHQLRLWTDELHLLI